MPLIAWIAASLALLAVLTLAAALWFDRLFEAPTAVYAPSLVEHLDAHSVLGVFAHPDDETLAVGALADAARREGVAVRTITLTGGESGYPEPHICRREDLRLVRESELRRYGYVLGIDHLEIWDFRDGGLQTDPNELIIDRLIQRIRLWKPELVITFDPAGGYNGHPDHRATGAITAKALMLSFDSAYKPELGETHRPEHLVYMVAPTRALGTLGGPALRAVAAVQPDANLPVPADRKLHAVGWRTHASQHLARAYPLHGWLLFDFWDKEHYLVSEPDLITLE